MAQRQKPRLRFSERLAELHEQEDEDSGQFLHLLRTFFLPTLLIVGLAVVVSVLTWLKDSPVVAVALIVVCAAALIVRRRLKSKQEPARRVTD
jgi:Flp pilus assembly protein TadB